MKKVSIRLYFLKTIRSVILLYLSLHLFVKSTLALLLLIEQEILTTYTQES